MGLQKLDTSSMQEVAVNFRSSIERFSSSKVRIKQINTNLITEWVGKSSNSYQRQFSLLLGKLDDIEEDLYEFYDAIVEAEVAFIDADLEISKKLSK